MYHLLCRFQSLFLVTIAPKKSKFFRKIVFLIFTNNFNNFGITFQKHFFLLLLDEATFLLFLDEARGLWQG